MSALIITLCALLVAAGYALIVWMYERQICDLKAENALLKSRFLPGVFQQRLAAENPQQPSGDKKKPMAFGGRQTWAATLSRMTRESAAKAAQLEEKRMEVIREQARAEADRRNEAAARAQQPIITNSDRKEIEELKAGA
jgi:type IV secretory pathway VirJ component